MMKIRHKIKVGITMGDPSGIGPAIISKAIYQIQKTDKLLSKLADFTVIGDKWVFKRLSVSGYRLAGVKLIDLDNVSHKNFGFGKVRVEYGKASIEYLDEAIGLLKTRKIDCLVTAPISKESINKAGFRYSGHTEYLSERTHTKDLVMMLLNEHIKFSLVTRHVPLKDVSGKLSRELLKKTILLSRLSLKEIFLVKNPRIVVCGLNPHASDNGLIGKEENTIIKPALEELRSKIKNIDGPLSPDVAIARAKQKLYDCVIAMYHDQAMIPLKLDPGSSGVNITLGLPFIRTSPLHGTAFDIAKNQSLANPNSLIQAIRLAVECTLNQRKD